MGMHIQLFKRNKTFWIRYSLNGKQYRESLKTQDSAVARRVVVQLEKQVVLGVHQVPNEKYPFDQFWERYFKYAETHKRPKTIQIDRWAIKELCNHQNVQCLQDLSTARIESFKEHLKRSGSSPNSVNIHLRHLSSIFGMVVKWGLLAKNPFSGIAKFKTEKKPPRFLTKEQIEILLEIAKKQGRDLYLVFLLGIFSGLRKNEIVNTRWEWFNFERRTITLTPLGDFHLKTYECRTLPLHSRIEEALLPEHQNEGYIFQPDKTEHHWQYRYEFKTAFNTVCRKAELNWVTPHVLRHTFASQLASAGVSLYKISQWLGRSNFSTTQIYAHLQAGDAEIEKI